VLSRILDWDDRSTLVLFGDGAGAVVLERCRAGLPRLRARRRRGGRRNLWLPGSGSRRFDDSEKYVKMNGPEVFKFATRILVQSAEDLLATCGLTIDDVDLYIHTRPTGGSSTTQPASSGCRLNGW